MNTSDATTILNCPTCGGAIGCDVPFRQCPRCLLELCRAPAASSYPETDSLARESAEFGDYELLERVGRGGMGVVYKARQRSLNRIVAIKMIRMGELASPADLARFRRESEAAAKLDHPRIVPIYEVGERDANPFLVMRFIDGRSLAEALDDFRGRSAEASRDSKSAPLRRQHYDRFARMISTVARSVHYAHERGVLHRDLKPSNILLDREENPHLTDFGIARLADEESALTLTAELVGTPSYMSPEQASGKRAGVRSDVYSLGAILYELLTGRPPFQGSRPVEILRQVIEQEALHPRTINESVDPDLSVICLKCLDKDPDRRYRTALALAEDLERWQRREPILARPASLALRCRRWLARNPAVAVLMLGLAIGLAATSILWLRTLEEQRRKTIALAILRTESARQLQEIWDSPKPHFAIRSETLAAMSGREPAEFTAMERRFTLAFVANGNPLDRLLGAAPLLAHVEQAMSASSRHPTRLDVRIYKRQSEARADFIAGDIDFLQMNPREYVRAKAAHPGLRPLVRGISSAAPRAALNESAVIFSRASSGISNLAQLSGRSILLGTEDSTLSFWTKVHLSNAGIPGPLLSKWRYLDSATEVVPGLGTLPGPSLGNPFSDMTPVEAVAAGLYDVGVVREIRFAQVAKGRELVALKRFPDSGCVVVGQDDLPPLAAGSFCCAMTNLTDPQMLQTFTGFPRKFEPCSDADFTGVRNALEAESRFEPSNTP